MSFNIRYQNPHDGENAWEHRKDLVASMVRLYRPDLLGIQEAFLQQISDLAAQLPDYAWLGVGREDGHCQGEFTPIFYRPERFTLLNKDTFWLSKTPDVPGSTDWKACCTRIVTWAKFQDRFSGHDFFYFNTHLDQVSKCARRKSAKLLLERLPKIAGDAPLVLTGDLNCTEESKPYTILTQADEPCAFYLRDAKRVSLTPHHGPSLTFHNFYGNLEAKIDYIFVANGFDVLLHAVLADHWDGRYPSDHLPISADLAFGLPL